MKKITMVLDGIVGAGKTTLGRELCKSEKFLFIGDIAFEDPILSQSEELKRDGLNLVKLSQELKKNPNWVLDDVVLQKLDEAFLYADLRRERYVKTLEESEKNLLLERNHTTTLAYSYAISEKFRKKNFSILLSKYKEIQSEMLIPHLYIYLSIDLPTSIERQKKYKQNTFVEWVWNDKEFVGYFKEFYEFFIHTYEREAKLYKLDTKKSLQQSLHNLKIILKSEVIKRKT